MGVLLLVRHGQASFGAADYDVLSDLGAEQARLLGARLAPLAGSVLRVVAGGLRRQQDTARHLLTAMGLPPERMEVDPRWDEYDTLDVLSGVPPREVADNRAFQALLEEALRRWTGGQDDDLYREPWPAFRGRCLQGLRELAAEPETTVVVTSGGPVSVAAAELVGGDPDVWLPLNRVMVNASVTKVISGRSGSSLVAYNDHAHLEVRPGLVTYR